MIKNTEITHGFSFYGHVGQSCTMTILDDHTWASEPQVFELCWRFYMDAHHGPKDYVISSFMKTMYVQYDSIQSSHMVVIYGDRIQ